MSHGQIAGAQQPNAAGGGTQQVILAAARAAGKRDLEWQFGEILGDAHHQPRRAIAAGDRESRAADPLQVISQRLRRRLRPLGRPFADHDLHTSPLVGSQQDFFRSRE
jgi:hypothetical protein